MNAIDGTRNTYTNGESDSKTRKRKEPGSHVRNAESWRLLTTYNTQPRMIDLHILIPEYALLIPLHMVHEPPARRPGR